MSGMCNVCGLHIDTKRKKMYHPECNVKRFNYMSYRYNKWYYKRYRKKLLLKKRLKYARCKE
jgi:hypothetical protein